MSDSKNFLTYNQQMRKLRNDKNIDCYGSKHKKKLIRAGYFNIINGYKAPFTCGRDANGNHIYLPDTSIDQIYYVRGQMGIKKLSDLDDLKRLPNPPLNYNNFDTLYK